MYIVPEEDRKIFLEYLAKRPYIEVAALIARIAAWKKSDKKSTFFYFISAHILNHLHTLCVTSTDTLIVAIKRGRIHDRGCQTGPINRGTHP